MASQVSNGCWVTRNASGSYSVSHYYQTWVRLIAETPNGRFQRRICLQIWYLVRFSVSCWKAMASISVPRICTFWYCNWKLSSWTRHINTIPPMHASTVSTTFFHRIELLCLCFLFKQFANHFLNHPPPRLQYLESILNYFRLRSHSNDLPTYPQLRHDPSKPQTAHYPSCLPSAFIESHGRA